MFRFWCLRFTTQTKWSVESFLALARSGLLSKNVPLDNPNGNHCTKLQVFDYRRPRRYGYDKDGDRALATNDKKSHVVRLREHLLCSARSCEIKIDGGQWWVAEWSVKKNKRNLMIKELRSLDITWSKSPVTGYEALFSDRRTFICYRTINNTWYTRPRSTLSSYSCRNLLCMALYRSCFPGPASSILTALLIRAIAVKSSICFGVLKFYGPFRDLNRHDDVWISVWHWKCITELWSMAVVGHEDRLRLSQHFFVIVFMSLTEFS